MALQAHPTDAGFFYDPELAAAPGTFAVIVGVSAYPHLENGSGERADPTYDLGQLAVSALTAHRFFKWIRELYRFTDAPLSWCWMLASPTAEEIAVEPALGTYPIATLDTCAKAIKKWHSAIALLQPDIAEQSRSIFFFSGHGIERGRDRQILLPADYLKYGAADVAMSTYNLAAGLRDLGNLADIFFVDACRALPKDMSGIEINGVRILNEHSGLSADPRRFSPIVYASASGGETWQPDTVTGGISVFGEALIEGLQLEAARNPECGHPAHHITLNPLTEFMNRRIVALLGTSVTGRSPVRVNDFADICVTDITSPLLAAAPPAPKPPKTGAKRGPRKLPRAGGAKTIRRERPAAGPPAGHELARATMGDFLDFGTAGRTAGGAAEPPMPPRAKERHSLEGVIAANESFGTLHGYFGHETLTEMWTRAVIEPVKPGVRPDILIDTFERFGKSGMRVGFRIETAHNAWIEFPSQYLDVSFYSVLPAAWGPESFIFDAEIVEDNGRPLSFELALSLDNEGLIGQAARLWEKHCLMQAEAVLAEADAMDFERMVRDKRASPISAAVAGLVLLRARQYGRLHDWLRNLSDWFPYLPDGAVLWAEQLRQSKKWEGEPREIVDHLLRLEERGLPLFAGVLEYALQIAQELCDYVYDKPDTLTTEQQGRATRLRRLRDRLARASSFARAGGLFQVFQASPGKLSADLVRPQVVAVAVERELAQPQ